MSENGKGTTNGAPSEGHMYRFEVDSKEKIKKAEGVPAILFYENLYQLNAEIGTDVVTIELQEDKEQDDEKMK